LSAGTPYFTFLESAIQDEKSTQNHHLKSPFEEEILMTVLGGFKTFLKIFKNPLTLAFFNGQIYLLFEQL